MSIKSEAKKVLEDKENRQALADFLIDLSSTHESVLGDYIDPDNLPVDKQDAWFYRELINEFLNQGVEK